MIDQRAFPTYDDFGHVATDGMALRDWFAGQALNACIGAMYSTDNGVPEAIARNAYRMADAMMSQREAFVYHGDRP